MANDPQGFGQQIGPVGGITGVVKPVLVGGGPIKPGPGNTFAFGGGPTVVSRPASITQFIRPPGLQAPFSVQPSTTAFNNFAPRPPSEVKGTIAGAYSPIPIVYGEARVIGKLFRWVTDTWFVGIYVFCRGEIDSFQRLSIDGREIDVSAKGTTEFTDATLTGSDGYCQLFLGTSSQNLGTTASPPDATAASRVTDWTADTYANYACAVIQLSREDFDLTSIPRVEAVIRGVKTIDDPRASPSLGYSNNSALCLAHFLTTYYDSGTTADSTTLAAVANRADGVGAGNTLSDSSKRHTWGMVVGERPRQMADLVAFLEAAARCYAWEEAGVWYFIPDGPTSSSHTIDESRIIKGTASLRGVSASDQPDDVRVRWYDVTNNVTGLAEALGNVSGTVSEISAPWIGSHAEAKRFAVERYNHLRNENLLLQVDVHSVGLKIRRGEVFTYTDATLGLASKEFRCTQLEVVAPGIWRLYGREYLASTYSDSIATDPVTGTGKPDASAINPPTLAVSGTSTAAGRLARIDLTFQDATNSPAVALDYAFFRRIQVDVYDADQSPEVLLTTVYTNSQSATSVSGLPADVNFTVKARVISTAGAQGAYTTESVTKPVLPTPGTVSNVRIDCVAPAIVGGKDSIRVRVRWDDPDYRAWLGYRAYVYLVSPDEYTDLGLSTQFDLSNFDAPHQIVELPQGGVGEFDLEAPVDFEAFGNSGGTVSAYGNIVIKAYNALGVEGAGVWAGADPRFVIAQTDEIGNASTNDPALPDPNWEDKGADSNGARIVDCAMYITGAWICGLWVNIYDSDASGSNLTFIRREFVSLARGRYEADSGDSPLDRDNWTDWAGQIGVAYYSGSATVPTDSGLRWRMRVLDPGTTAYRVYKYQVVGMGDQVGPEVTLTEKNASPANNVHAL